MINDSDDEMAAPLQESEEPVALEESEPLGTSERPTATEPDRPPMSA